VNARATRVRVPTALAVSAPARAALAVYARALDANRARMSSRSSRKRASDIARDDATRRTTTRVDV
jgi:hypothetical protein